MLVFIVILAILLMISLVHLYRYKMELRSMTQFLAHWGTESNARLLSTIKSREVIELDKAMNKVLDERQQEKRMFEKRNAEFQDGFAFLSHDIRTPLAGAQGYMQLIAEETDEEIQQKYLKVVRTRLDVLKELLDELFLYTQVSGAGYRVECAEQPLSSVISAALVAHYPLFAERNWEPHVQLDESGNDKVMLDNDAMKRILDNLIINALRHGVEAPVVIQEGALLTVSNRVAHPEVIEVDRLFDRFYRGAQSNKVTGSGLGLSIVSHLMTAMGGTAEAALEGDKLTITLRLKKSNRQ